MTVGVVLCLAIGTYALRVAGPMLRDRMRVSARVETLMSIAAIVLLGAFVVVSTAWEAGEPAGWARFAGVVAAGVLAALRAPFVLVVVTAAVATAMLRAFGLA
ncbi:AzlD domain-containing protein [Parasphingorhabdus pacifica]